MIGKIKGITIDTAILEEVTEILSLQFQKKTVIESVILLSEPSRRNLVLRIILQNSANGVPNSIILKQSIIKKSAEDNGNEAFGRFSRDWAGLEFLSNLKTSASIVPKFYGGSTQHRFVLIEDLGAIHTSLVDVLMKYNKNAAEAALNRFMKAMATLHGNTYITVKNHRAMIQKLNPSALMWQDDFDDMLSKISTLLEKFHIPLGNDLINEINYVLNLAKDPGPFTALMHGDMCPHNVFDDPIQNKIYIIDFEWSFVGNVLLDAVVLRMCMPTSWCVKAFPEDIIESFEQIYKTELIKYIPAANNDSIYNQHYVAACGYYMLWRVISLNDILETEIDIHDPKFPIHPMWKPEDNIRRPRNLYRFQAFIEQSEKHDIFLHLRSMAISILNELKDLWPDVEPLKLYPAFRK